MARGAQRTEGGGQRPSSGGCDAELSFGGRTGNTWVKRGRERFWAEGTEHGRAWRIGDSRWLDRRSLSQMGTGEAREIWGPKTFIVRLETTGNSCVGCVLHHSRSTPKPVQCTTRTIEQGDPALLLREGSFILVAVGSLQRIVGRKAT